MFVLSILGLGPTGAKRTPVHCQKIIILIAFEEHTLSSYFLNTLPSTVQSPWLF